MKYCGIDLHSNNSVVSVIDEADQVVAEKRLPNDLEKIIGLMKPWQAELAGVDPASISGMVNGALGIGETGVGPGIEDELGNAALQGKIQGTGTTAGKSWGNAFLAYVQDNVPATLVGLLVDLVTPGVRAKITADASAEGAT